MSPADLSGLLERLEGRYTRGVAARFDGLYLYAATPNDPDVLALVAEVRELVAPRPEPRGCPTPGACSCPGVETGPAVGTPRAGGG